MWPWQKKEFLIYNTTNAYPGDGKYCFVYHPFKDTVRGLYQLTRWDRTTQSVYGKLILQIDLASCKCIEIEHLLNNPNCTHEWHYSPNRIVAELYQ